MGVVVVAAALWFALLLCAANGEAPATSPAQQRWLAETRYCVEYLSDLDVLLNIAGVPLDARCTCRPALPADLTACVPRVVGVTPLNGADMAGSHARQGGSGGSGGSGGGAVTAAAVKQHIGPAQDVRVVDVRRHHFSCVDGRGPDEVLGTWGGDAGEMLLALAVWERVGQRPLTPEHVAMFVKAYVKLSPQRHVYYHTDATALAFVMETAGVEDVDITMAPVEVQAALLRGLTSPNGQGCGHLRAMMENPVEYRVGEPLVAQFITAFHRLLWDTSDATRTKIQYYVLHGHPADGVETDATNAEVAYLEFESSPACVREQRAPAFPPYADDVSVFVSHPAAVEAKRNATAGLLAKVSGLGKAELRMNLNAVGKEWAAITEGKLVPLGLPRFIVSVG